MVTKRILINKIITDEEILPREQINEDYVDNLVEALKAKAKFPPVDTFFDGKRHFLADGHHRHEAFIKTGRKTIEAVVHQGDKREAILFSCGVNAEHGLPRTNADKRKVVDRLLRDSEWRELSDRQIAKHCAVTPQFVGKRRHELTINGFKSPSKRKGADGRMIETKKIGKGSGGSEGKQPSNQKEKSIPVLIKVDKDRLPPKSKGKNKNHNDGKGEEVDSEKSNPTPNLAVIISETKRLISDLQDCLRDFNELLPDKSKIQKSKEKDFLNQWKRLMPLWSKFAVHVSKNFDWIA